MIREGSGDQFCPTIVRHFRAVVMPYPIGHEIELARRPHRRRARAVESRPRRPRPCASWRRGRRGVHRRHDGRRPRPPEQRGPSSWRASDSRRRARRRGLASGRTVMRPSCRRTVSDGCARAALGAGDRLARRGPRAARSRAPACAAGRGRRAWRASRSSSRRRRSSAAAAVRSSAAASARARRARVARRGRGGGRLAGERGGARRVARSPAATARRVAARSSRSCWCRRARWRATWCGGARESRASVRARSTHGAAALALEPRGGPCSAARAARAVDGHGGLGGVGGRRAGDGGDVVDQRAVRVVADRGDHRHAQQRDRAAQGLVAEREQVGQRAAAAGDDDHVDLRARREVLQRARDRRARRGGPARARTPRRRGPPSRGGAGRPATSSRALPDSPVDDADAARQRGPRQRLLRREQALGVQPRGAAARAAPAGRPRRRRAAASTAKENAGRGGARARVVVAPARDDHLRAVGQRARARAPRSPRATSSTAARRAASRSSNHTFARPGLEAEHLAEHLHAREPAQPVAQRGRVVADRERAREDRAGDAVRRFARRADGSRRRWTVLRRAGGGRVTRRSRAGGGPATVDRAGARR